MSSKEDHTTEPLEKDKSFVFNVRERILLVEALGSKINDIRWRSHDSNSAFAQDKIKTLTNLKEKLRIV